VELTLISRISWTFDYSCVTHCHIDSRKCFALQCWFSLRNFTAIL